MIAKMILMISLHDKLSALGIHASLEEAVRDPRLKGLGPAHAPPKERDLVAYLPVKGILTRCSKNYRTISESMEKLSWMFLKGYR